ncbi:hypothetical protein GTY65_28030 [Streptomyces sp. SID8379]|uniref:hypothetical protein n=1 Tax=unclassified Streptomyces TaxID=2593676 RepID=UPI000360A717|nr:MULTISPECIES: hypothetical protein [unclassified Streptomyces]MYW67895.1 hypothetical protein [Streptomyces sp. SID8379]
MTRDLYNVRAVAAPDEDQWAPTPLTPDEENRYLALLFGELGNQVADHGAATHPAYTTEDRRRIVEVGRRLSAHWGMPVRVEAVDTCRMRISVGTPAQPDRSA